jgi:hypothetical protein
MVEGQLTPMGPITTQEDQKLKPLPKEEEAPLPNAEDLVDKVLWNLNAPKQTNETTEAFE